MTNDAEAQEVHATITDAGDSQEPANGGQAQRPDVLDGEDIDDEGIDDADVDGEDVVVIEGMSVVRADDDTSPVSAADGVSPPDADDDDTARPGMPVGAGTPARAGGTPAAAGMPSDTDVPADTNVAGDPDALREQWAAIQSTFVDDPRGSVAAAAEFVTDTIAAMVASAQERERGLRGEWDRDGVDTEGLRNALRGYRGLLERLAPVAAAAGPPTGRHGA
jgi:hypothetical protein